MCVCVYWFVVVVYYVVVILVSERVGKNEIFRGDVW